MGAFEAAGDDLLARLDSGMDAFAEMILADSLEQCPIETGTLRRSAKIVSTTTVPAIGGGFMLRGADGRFIGAAPYGGGEITKVIGYGFGDEVNPKTRRPADEYAVPVHERVEAYHKPPTKAKFLEDAVFAHAALMEPILKAYMSEGHTPIQPLALGAIIEADSMGLPPEDLDRGDHPVDTPHV